MSTRTRPIATLALAISIMAVSSARADLRSDMESFYEDLNFQNVTMPGVYEGQSAGYFTGGGAFLRTPARNYTLYSVQWPRFRAGCGGIDLFTGGFSFINASEFVDMLQNIGSAAISHAFLLALSTISPKIASVMEQVQTWAQRYGLNSINACEAGAKLVGGALEVFGQEKQACIMERVNANGDSWSEAERACTTGGLRRVTQAASETKKLMFTEGNLAWRAMQRNDFFASDTDLAQAMMNLSGTVIIKVVDPGSEDSSVEHQVIPSILTDNQGRKLIEALLRGGEITIKGCSNGTTGEFACTEMNTSLTVTIAPGESLIERVRTLLDGMVGKIGADEPLTDAEKGLLSATALPVYKYLTVSAAFLGSVVQSDVDRYAAIIARDILYTYLNDILGKMVASVRSLDFKADDKVTDFLDGVMEARREIRRFKLDLGQDFDEALEFTRKTRDYERAVIGRLSPGLFRNLVFANAR